MEQDQQGWVLEQDGETEVALNQSLRSKNKRVIWSRQR